MFFFCPHPAICFLFVLILRYMCVHLLREHQIISLFFLPDLRVTRLPRSYVYCICPHATIYLHRHNTIHVSSCYYILLNICRYTTTWTTEDRALVANSSLSSLLVSWPRKRLGTCAWEGWVSDQRSGGSGVAVVSSVSRERRSGERRLRRPYRRLWKTCRLRISGFDYVLRIMYEYHVPFACFVKYVLIPRPILLFSR